MKQKIIIEIVCFLLIVLFVYAAVSKLRDYRTFQQQLNASKLLHDYSATLAWAVPTIELIISILLTAVYTRSIGLYASLILLVLFTIYIIVMLMTVARLPCSCGGIIKNLTWRQHAVFNSGFIILSIAGIYLTNKQKGFISTPV